MLRNVKPLGSHSVHLGRKVEAMPQAEYQSQRPTSSVWFPPWGFPRGIWAPGKRECPLEAQGFLDRGKQGWAGGNAVSLSLCIRSFHRKTHCLSTTDLMCSQLLCIIFESSFPVLDLGPSGGLENS